MCMIIKRISFLAVFTLFVSVINILFKLIVYLFNYSGFKNYELISWVVSIIFALIMLYKKILVINDFKIS